MMPLGGQILFETEETSVQTIDYENNNWQLHLSVSLYQNFTLTGAIMITYLYFLYCKLLSEW